MSTQTRQCKQLTLGQQYQIQALLEGLMQKEIADIVGISESAAGFKQYINSLVISIAWQGASTPIAWRCFDKCRGHSNAPLWQDRCRLF